MQSTVRPLEAGPQVNTLNSDVKSSVQDLEFDGLLGLDTTNDVSERAGS